MSVTYSVSATQTHLPRLLKDAETEGSIAITRRDETVAFLISRKQMDAIAETLEVLANPEAMLAIREYECGAMKFLPLTALDDAG